MLFLFFEGGSLEKLIAQDGHLPEDSIKTFSVDLINGLHFLHSLSIIFCDLRPSKVCCFITFFNFCFLFRCFFFLPNVCFGIYSVFGCFRLLLFLLNYC